MSLGAMASVSESSAVGPIFHDNVSQVGDGSYPTGGSLGLQAKLRTLRGDQRTILAVKAYSAGGYVVDYNPATDTLKVQEQDGSGALAEVANTTNLSGVTLLLNITSK